MSFNKTSQRKHHNIPLVSEFDPSIISVTPLTKQIMDKSTGLTYTLFVSNKNDQTPIRLRVNDVRCIGSPLLPYNPTYHANGEQDLKRAQLTIYPTDGNKGNNELRDCFKNIQKYITTPEFQKEVFPYIMSDPSNVMELKAPLVKPGDKKKDSMYGQMDRMRIKFGLSYSADKNVPQVITTVVFVLNHETSKLNRVDVKTISDLENVLHKNAVVDFVFQISKIYCMKQATPATDKVINPKTNQLETIDVTKHSYGIGFKIIQLLIKDQGTGSSMEQNDMCFDEYEVDDDIKTLPVKPTNVNFTVVNTPDAKISTINQEPYDSEDDDDATLPVLSADNIKKSMPIAPQIIEDEESDSEEDKSITKKQKKKYKSVKQDSSDEESDDDEKPVITVKQDKKIKSYKVESSSDEDESLRNIKKSKIKQRKQHMYDEEDDDSDCSD